MTKQQEAKTDNLIVELLEELSDKQRSKLINIVDLLNK